ncbi:hypothetical protein [Natrononativus amylolyticus]|uniref:hypothetical protein n=1 Tax=Natrononativus amylolyticus TaxID=2963434 RepID=UPI0020CD7F57|nr:hypothetical protein [Natrononativus amylolyticus]
MSPRFDRTTAGAGALGGAAAYALGYLLTYLTQRGSVDERLEAFNFVAALFGGEPIPSWQAVGWLFYNAHFVDTELPALAGTRTQNFVASADGGSLALLYLLPPLALLGAGFAVATASSARTLEDGGLRGALVVLGYLPLAVLGVVAFGYAIGEGTVAPDAITAVGVAGVVYPVAFGGIGGAIAAVIARR